MGNPRELADQAFALLQDALRESEARNAELREQLGRQPLPEGSAEERLDILRQRLEEAEAERDRARVDVGRVEEVLAEERCKLDQLKAKLEIAESGPDKLTKKEINYWRSKADEFDRSSREQKARIAELRRELQEHETTLAAHAESEAASRRDADAARSENEHLRATLQERDARIVQLSAQLESIKTELAAKSDQRLRLEAELEESERARQSLTAEIAAAAEQIAGLEQELREEKECTDNLSEVANERRERITSLEDRLAEAEERYEEARWRLGKAQHFERLLKRRKGLIAALIERIRVKSKANVALKAGLDGLRTFKAAAEAKQHKLLAHIDKLKAKVKEHEETISRYPGSTITEADLGEAQARVAELDQRVESQVEIIQTLEEELKTSKAMKQVRTNHGAEIELLQRELDRLRVELDYKVQIVARLENDADEQQRKLAKLRGTESETLRLKGKLKEQETTVASLKDEVDGWKRKYELMSAETSPPYRSAAEK